MKEICVIVPIYKEKLSFSEEFSVDRTRLVLKTRDIFFMAPADMDCSYYQLRYPDIRIIFFKKKYFRSVHTYSELLLSRQFYKRFLKYKFMLIAQSDAVILSSRDELDFYMEMDYDYIGAPWESENKLYPMIFKGMDRIGFVFGTYMKPFMARIGNGGFSLRKISAMLSIIENHPLAVGLSKKFKRANEDTLLCYYLNAEKKYTVPPVSVAEKFVAEQTAKKCLENGSIPYAIHAYETYVGGVDEIKKYMV